MNLSAGADEPGSYESRYLASTLAVVTSIASAFLLGEVLLVFATVFVVSRR